MFHGPFGIHDLLWVLFLIFLVWFTAGLFRGRGCCARPPADAPAPLTEQRIRAVVREELAAASALHAGPAEGTFRVTALDTGDAHEWKVTLTGTEDGVRRTAVTAPRPELLDRLRDGTPVRARLVPEGRRLRLEEIGPA